MSIIQRVKGWLNLRKEVDRQNEEIEACKDKLNICRVNQKFREGSVHFFRAKVVRVYGDGTVSFNVYPPASEIHASVTFNHYSLINPED